VLQALKKIPSFAELSSLAYWEYGYRLWEIAEHLGMHYATVSRKLKRWDKEKRGDV
jgi:hypothetical protein